MKHCPTCSRTFDDNLRFCQVDGTPLVISSEQPQADFDPYKTIVGGSSTESNESNFDPMKTVLGNQGTSDLPSSSPFDAPKIDLSKPADNYSEPLPYKEPTNQGWQQPTGDSFGNQPFNTPSFQDPPSFGQQQYDQANANSNQWTPPPVPQQNWGNQGLGANTPFQPPMSQGQNQTFAIISLVSGILGLPIAICCGIFSIPLPIIALITGFLGMTNANKNPQQYGGKTFAIVGMVLGGISLLISILLLILGVASVFLPKH